MPALKYLSSEREAVVTATIYPYRYGQVFYQGSWWLAHCKQPVILLPETPVWVIQQKGIRLLIEPVELAQPVVIEPFFSSAPSSRCGENEGVISQPKSQSYQFTIKFLTVVVGALLFAVPPALSLNRLSKLQLGNCASGVPETQMPQFQAQQIATAASARCEILGINPRFCQSWLDEANLYSDYWSTTDDRLFNGLSRLSLQARTRLGFYRHKTSNRQYRIMRFLNLSEDDVNEMTDRQFFALFPQRKYQSIMSSEWMTRQVWFACRENILIRLEQQTSRVIR